MGRLSTSWNLMKASWGVVKQDKELLWMPVLSFLASVVAVAAIVGVGFLATPDLFTAEGEASPAGIALAALLYLTLAFISVYFHAAVVAAAHERLEGGDPTVGSALRKANGSLGRLFGWSVIVATVNILLQALREKGGNMGRIVAGIAGGAWNLATYFVVPNLLFTEEGVGSSLKSSVGIFRRRWGETIVGHVGVGFAMGVLTFLWVVLGVILTVALGAGLGTAGFIVGAVLLVTGVVLLSIIGSVLSAVYKAALYRFATKGEAGDAFPAQTLQGAAY